MGFVWRQNPVRRDPWGGSEKGVREETGLEIEIIKPVRVWTFFKNRRKQVVGVTTLCRYRDGKVRLSEEHRDFA